MYNEIGYEDFTTIINEEKDYRELKESIRMMKTQRSAIYGSKNQNLLEKQRGNGLLSSLGIKTPLREIPLLGNVLNAVSLNSHYNNSIK